MKDNPSLRFLIMYKEKAIVLEEQVKEKEGFYFYFLLFLKN